MRRRFSSSLFLLSCILIWATLQYWSVRSLYSLVSVSVDPLAATPPLSKYLYTIHNDMHVHRNLPFSIPLSVATYIWITCLSDTRSFLFLCTHERVFVTRQGTPELRSIDFWFNIVCCSQWLSSLNKYLHGCNWPATSWRAQPKAWLWAHFYEFIFRWNSNMSSALLTMRGQQYSMALHASPSPVRVADMGLYLFTFWQPSYCLLVSEFMRPTKRSASKWVTQCMWTTTNIYDKCLIEAQANKWLQWVSKRSTKVGMV